MVKYFKFSLVLVCAALFLLTVPLGSYADPPKKGGTLSIAHSQFNHLNSAIQSGVATVGGKWSWNGFSKGMSPDGEFMIGELYGDLESGTTWKAVYGTGKWKGINGETKGKMITTGKPIVLGTDQLCEKYIGWIELSK